MGHTNKKIFTKIKINQNNNVVEAILLAKLTMEVEVFVTKNCKILWFKKQKRVLEKQRIDFCLVYLPWKHQEKELMLIKQKDCVSNIDFFNRDGIVNVNKFESEYIEECDGYKNNCKFEVENFVGYDFLHKNKSFIADLYCGEKSKCLTILYKKMPQILNEVFDEEAS